MKNKSKLAARPNKESGEKNVCRRTSSGKRTPLAFFIASALYITKKKKSILFRLHRA